MINMDCPAAQNSRPGKEKYLPGLELMTQGYNIYKSDPVDRWDQGFSKKVFAFNWEKTGAVYYKDLKFEYPAEMEVIYAPMCSAQTSSTTSKDEREYQ